MNPYDINPFALAQLKAPAPEETKKDAPGVDPNLMQEISWSEQDVLQSYMPFANNPDPVVRNKSLKIYREMQQDDQIKACLSMRIQARLSSTWEIKPGKEGDALSEKMARFIKFILSRMEGTFQQNLTEIFSAIQYGFSVTEKVYEYMEKAPAEFKGMIGIRALKTREPFNYDFKVDAHGNLLGLVYTGLTGPEGPEASQLSGGQIITPATSSLNRLIPSLIAGKSVDIGSVSNPFPKEKFIIYSYNRQFGNHYGMSDFNSVFPWWLMKKHGRKFWAIWLERYASPFIWASVKRDAGLKKKALDAIDDFIRNLSSRQGVRVSDAVTLNAMEFSGTAADTYEKSVEAYNRFMAKGLLMPSLMGYTQQPSTGSYSQAQKHFDAFIWVLQKMGQDCSETIVGEQIIKPLIEMNFGEVDQELLPKFYFLSLDEDSIKVRSEIVSTLGGSGFIDPNEEWVRDFLTLPKKDPSVVLLSPLQIAQKAAQEAGGEDSEKQNKPGEPKAGEEKPKPKEPPAKEEQAKTAKEKSVEIKFQEREPNAFEKKINPKKFQRQLDSAEDAMRSDLTVILEEVRDDMIDQVKRKEVIQSGDAREVSRVNVNVTDLKKTLEMWLLKIHLDSKLRALEELETAGVQVTILRRFATFAEEKTPFEPWQPLPPIEAIEFFKRKVTAKIVTKNGRTKVIDLTTGVDLDYIREKAFTVAGIVRDDILNDAKQIILNGIKRQDQIGAVKDLKDLFNKYLQQGIAVDDELMTTARLNTIVRTNVSEAVNQGRAAMMTDPDVEDFVQYFQYTAILDQRTTEYCNCMDERVFRVEDLPALNPPAHFNCRSFIVPVTQFELDDLKAEGKGITVDDPCPERMAGFADLKRPITPIIPAEIVKGLDKPTSREELLRKQLDGVITRCPYRICASQNIKFKRSFYNIGEFECVDCGLPFRVSNAGDMYLYDAGLEKWERVSEGLIPQYFQEDGFTTTVCPYRLCRSGEIHLDRTEHGISHYSCNTCTLPFRVSEKGDYYLYDAGQESWKKMKGGR